VVKNYGLGKTNWPCSLLFKNSALILLRFALFSLLVLCPSRWNDSATAATKQNAPVSSSNISVLEQLRPGAFAGAGEMPGTLPAFAALDGDQSRDFGAARLAGNRCGVFVVLSSRSDVTILYPPVQSGIFTVCISDVNNDRLQDIIVRGPGAFHPAAVWLGKGNGIFEAADHSFFQNDPGLTESTACRSSCLQADQDLMLDPPDTVCEKMNLAFIYSDPEPDGITVEDSSSIALPCEHCSLTLRSPPGNLSF
jgi:hypothetical protein